MLSLACPRLQGLKQFMLLYTGASFQFHEPVLAMGRRLDQAYGSRRCVASRRIVGGVFVGPLNTFFECCSFMDRD